ncbi:phage/plasmid primase, P4 family [Acidimicrobiales bacterium]|nr:phage/plasmid primase, P4 family [Acidimicrobiales bacterium]
MTSQPDLHQGRPNHDFGYAVAAPAYRNAGWEGVLPLPKGEKQPPPSGFTGAGNDPTDEQLAGWFKTREEDNVALRMPSDVIGIDIDAYDGKPGKATIDELQGELGVLPDTWSSTSRTDGSGILFYRVPPDSSFVSGMAGVDIIQRGHRYAVVWPSIHPEGRRYRWFAPGEDDPVDEDEVPEVSKLPLLPIDWCTHLFSDAAHKKGSNKRPGEQDIETWLNAGNSTTNMEGFERQVLNPANAKVEDGRSRHDTMIQALVGLVRDADAGLYSRRDAIQTLRQWWLDVAATSREGGAGRTAESAEGEFNEGLRCAIGYNADGRVGTKHDLSRESNESTASEPDPSQFFSHEGLDHLRLKAAVLELGPIVTGPGGTLWRYSDGVYVQGGENEANRRVERLLGKKFRQQHAKQIVASLKIQVPFISEQQPAGYINCRNGLLKWSTGELMPHTPDVASTYQLAVNWNPEATCPHTDQWMAEVVDAETVALLWEIIGVSVRPDMPYHRAVLCYGHGRNGKGTFLRIIEKLIGSEFISAVTLQSLGEDRFAGADLFGKVANISGDLDARHIKRTDLFKMATGGDTIRAERKYGQPFTFVNQATMLFSANELPGTSDHTHGFFARWIIVPFTADLRGLEDPNIETKLHAELEGVLVKSVTALQELDQRGNFTLSASAKSATETYRTGADPVRSFADEQLHFDPEARQQRKDIYDHFRIWCEDNGQKSVAATKFYQRLAQLDGITDINFRSDGKRYVIGCYLKGHCQ